MDVFDFSDARKRFSIPEDVTTFDEFAQFMIALAGWQQKQIEQLRAEVDALKNLTMPQIVTRSGGKLYRIEVNEFGQPVWKLVDEESEPDEQ